MSSKVALLFIGFLLEIAIATSSGNVTAWR